jgi:hypothetical protein
MIMAKKYETLADAMYRWLEYQAKTSVFPKETADWISECVDAPEYRILEAILEPSKHQIRSGLKSVVLQEGTIVKFFPDPLIRAMKNVDKRDESEVLRAIRKITLGRFVASRGEFVVWRMFWSPMHNNTILLGAFQHISKHLPDYPVSEANIDVDDTTEVVYGFLMLDDISDMLIRGEVCYLGKVDTETRTQQ